MRFFTVFLCAALFACSKTPVVQTGPGANVNEYGLNQVDHSAFDKLFIAPQAKLSQYKRFYFAPLDTTQIEVVNPKIQNQRESEWRFTTKDAVQFSEAYSNAVEREFKKSDQFELVSAPGEKIAIVKSKITRFAPTAPKFDSIDRGVRSDFYTKISGDITIETEISDGSTGELLVNIEDNRDMGNDIHMRENNYAQFRMDLRNAFNGWSRAFVGQLQVVK